MGQGWGGGAGPGQGACSDQEETAGAAERGRKGAGVWDPKGPDHRTLRPRARVWTLSQEKSEATECQRGL